MPNEQKRINPSIAHKQVQGNKPSKKAGDGTTTFMVWSIAGTVLAACGGGDTKFVFVEGGGGGDGSDGVSAAGPGRITATDGPVRGARVFIDVDGNGIYTEGVDRDLGLTNAVGYVDLPADLRNRLVVIHVDVNGAVDAATDRTLSGVWRSLPQSGEFLIVSPLTDLLTDMLAYDRDNNPAAITGAGGEDAYLQGLLEGIFGDAPVIDEDGNPVLDAAGDRLRAPLVTLEDVMDIDNYNPLDAETHAKQLISRAAIALTVIEKDLMEIGTDGSNFDTDGSARLGGLTSFFADFRSDVRVDGRAEVALNGSDSGNGLRNRVEALVNQSKGLPAPIRPNRDTPLQATEDEDYSILARIEEYGEVGFSDDTARELLFGFDDPLGNRNVPSGLGGIYIKTQSEVAEVEFSDGARDLQIAVMFTLDDGRIVNIAQASANERGVLESIRAQSTVSINDEVLYYVSQSLLGRLILDPADNAHGEFHIRYLVFDGEHHSAVDADADTQNGEPDYVGILKINFGSVNDLPTNLRITGDRDPNTGDDVVSYVLSSEGRLVLTDDMLAGVLSVDDLETTSGGFTFRIDGADGPRFTVERMVGDDGSVQQVLRLADGVRQIDAGETYSIRIIAIDADGGETEIGLDLEIIQGGVYLIEPDETDIAGGGNRRYSDYEDANGDGIVFEELNPQDLEALGNPVAAAVDIGPITFQAAKTGAVNDVFVEIRTGLQGSGVTDESGITINLIADTIGGVSGTVVNIRYLPERTVAEIIEAVNTHAEARLFVRAEISATPTATIPPTAAAPLTGGSGIEILRTGETVSLDGGPEVTREINAIKVGTIGIEGGIDHPEGLTGEREFFTDTEGFVVIREGDDFNLYYLGSDTGDDDASPPEQLPVNIGIRNIVRDGEIDANATLGDANLDFFTIDAGVGVLSTPTHGTYSVTGGNFAFNETPASFAAVSDQEIPAGGGAVALVNPDTGWQVQFFAGTSINRETRDYITLARFTPADDIPALADTGSFVGLDFTAVTPGSGATADNGVREIFILIQGDENIGEDDPIEVEVVPIDDNSVRIDISVSNNPADTSFQDLLEAVQSGANQLVTAELTTPGTEDNTLTARDFAGFRLENGADPIPTFDLEQNTQARIPTVIDTFIYHINLKNLDDNDPTFETPQAGPDTSVAVDDDTQADYVVNVNEDVANNAHLFTVRATDADISDEIAYTIVSTLDANGADASSLFMFAVEDGVARVMLNPAGAGLDFERPNGESYTIMIRVTSTTDSPASVQSAPTIGAVKTVEQSLRINVVNVNEAPTEISIAVANQVAGNVKGAFVDYDGEIPTGADAGVFVTTLTTADEDIGDEHSYSVGGVDGGAFAIRNDNELWLVSDSREQGEIWAIEITTSDSAGASHSEAFTVLRNGLKITTDIGGETGAEVYSNGEGVLPEEFNPTADLLIGTLSDELGSTSFEVIYSDDVPAAEQLFFIQNDNEIYYLRGTETGDADADVPDTYTITVGALNAAPDMHEYEYIVNLENLNDEGPVFVASGDINVIGVDENRSPDTVVYTAQASDADIRIRAPDTAVLGDITFTSTKLGDGSAIGDSVKTVRIIFKTITRDDPENSEPMQAIIAVDNTDADYLDITLSVDADLSTTTWRQVLQAFNDHEAIVDDNGNITTPAASDSVTTTGLNTEQTLEDYFANTEMVGDFTQIGEAAGLILQGGMGDTITYALEAGQEDNDDFIIDEQTGELRFREGRTNFERPAPHTNGVYMVVITVVSASALGAQMPTPLTAAEQTTTQRVQITLTDINEAPTEITLANPFISGVNITTGALRSVDPDRPEDDITFSLVAGAGDDHNALFTINTDNTLTFTGRGETAGLFNRNDTGVSYSVRIQAQDEHGLTYERVVEIVEGSLFIRTIVDGENVDRFSGFRDSMGQGLLAENADGTGTAIRIPGVLTLVDATATLALATQSDVSNGDVSGIGDSAQFRLVNGVLSYIGSDSGNFEATDTLSITVKTTAGGEDSYEFYIIHLIDANDAPAFAISSPDVRGVLVNDEATSDLPDWITFNALRGQFTFAPEGDVAPGEYTVRVEFVDGEELVRGGESITRVVAGNTVAAFEADFESHRAYININGVEFRATESGTNPLGSSARFNFVHDGVAEDGIVITRVNGSPIEFTITFGGAAPDFSQQALVQAWIDSAHVNAFIPTIVAPRAPEADFALADWTSDAGVPPVITFNLRAGVAINLPHSQATDTINLNLVEGNRVNNEIEGYLRVVGDVESYGGTDGEYTGRYGTLAIDADGDWTYRLNNDAPAFLRLDGGKTDIERIEVQITLDDGQTATHNLEINIIGQDDVFTAENQGTRARIEVNGIEFRATEGGSTSFTVIQELPFQIEFGTTSTGISGWQITSGLSGGFDFLFRTQDGGNPGSDFSQQTVLNLLENPTSFLTQSGIDLTSIIDAQILEVVPESEPSDWSGTYIPESGTGTELDLNVALGRETTAQGFIRINGPVGDSTIRFGGRENGDGLARTHTYQGLYGTLVIDEDGDWTYTVDETNSVVAALPIGEVIPEQHFTIDISVGGGQVFEHNLYITLSRVVPLDVANQRRGGGADMDSYPATAVFESGAQGEASRSATGQLNIGGMGDITYDGEVGAGGIYTYEGTYGNLVINRSHQWTYTLNSNNDADLMALNSGQIATERFDLGIERGRQGAIETITFDVYGAGSEQAFDVSMQGARASVLIYGVEFRTLGDGPARHTGIYFEENVAGNISISGSIGILTNIFSQANIVRLFNDAPNNIDYVATIIEEMPNINTFAEWIEAEDGGAPAAPGNGLRNFIAGTHEADLGVTKGAMDDATAHGWLQVTGGDANEPITYGGNGVGTNTPTIADDHIDTRTYIHQGTYGDLVIDGDGDWVYTLGGVAGSARTTAYQTAVNGLADGTTATDSFDIRIERGSDSITQEIRIDVHTPPAADVLADTGIQVASEGARASIVINGVEFRAADDGALLASGNANTPVIFFKNARAGGVDDVVSDSAANSFTIQIADSGAGMRYSQAHIAGIWNAQNALTGSHLTEQLGDVTATIIDVLDGTTTPTAPTQISHWYLDRNPSNPTGVQEIVGATSMGADHKVSEDSDSTASGWLRVTDADGNGMTTTFDGNGVVENALTFGGAMTGTPPSRDGNTITDTRKYTYTGTYGTLVIDGDGDWVYTLNQDVDPDSINANLEDRFEIEITHGTQTTTHPIIISVESDGHTNVPASVARVIGHDGNDNPDLLVRETGDDTTAQGRIILNDESISGGQFGASNTQISGRFVHIGAYGELVIEADGNWTYTVNPTNPQSSDAGAPDRWNAALGNLNLGDTATEQFTIPVTIAQTLVDSVALSIAVLGTTGDAPDLLERDGRDEIVSVDNSLRPDEIEFAGVEISVTEGEPVILTEAMLPISDEDASDKDENGNPIGDRFSYDFDIHDTTIVAGGTSHAKGVIQRLLTDGGWANIGTDGTFTLTELRAGMIRFMHDGDEQFSVVDGYRTGTAEAVRISFTISDAKDTGEQRSFDLVVTPVNDALEQVNAVDINTGSEGDAILITNANLRFNDVDNMVEDLVYTLTEAPDHGWLQISADGGATWSNIARNATFTQDDIDENRVRYQHNASEERNDDFGYSVTDGAGNTTASTGTVSVDITTAINDAPTQDPIPAAGDTPHEYAFDYAASGVARVNPVGSNSVIVNESGNNLINASVIGVYDPDNTAGDITYTVGGLAGLNTGGVADLRLTLDSSGTGNPNNFVTLSDGASFTLQQVRSGAVRIQHIHRDNNNPPSDQSYSFTYTFTDGVAPTSAVQTLDIEVRAVNDVPTALNIGVTRIDPTIDTGANLNERVAPIPDTVFVTMDEETTDPAEFTYALVSGEGDADNARFRIIRNVDGQSQLRLVAGQNDLKLDGDNYSIRIRVTDTEVGTAVPAVQGAQSAQFTYILPVRSFDIDWDITTGGVQEVGALEFDLNPDSDPNTPGIQPASNVLDIGRFNIDVTGTPNAITGPMDEYRVFIASTDQTDLGAGNDYGDFTIAQDTTNPAIWTVSLTPNRENPIFKAIESGESLTIAFTLTIEYQPHMVVDGDRPSVRTNGNIILRSVETFDVEFIGTTEVPVLGTRAVQAYEAAVGTTDRAVDPDRIGGTGDDAYDARGTLALENFQDRQLLQNIFYLSDNLGDIDFQSTSVEQLENGPASIAGDYGTLYLSYNSVSTPAGIDWRYVLDPTGVQSVPLQTSSGSATTVERFTIKVADNVGNQSADTQLTISIFGQNDAPTFGLAEDGGTLGTQTVTASRNEEDTTPAVGTWEFGDVDEDSALRLFAGQFEIGVITASEALMFRGRYGDFTFNVNADADAGTWSYTVNQARANAIAHEETPVDALVLTVRDQYGLASDPIMLAVTVTGDNDDPTGINKGYSNLDNNGTAIDAVTESGYRADTDHDFTITGVAAVDPRMVANIPVAEQAVSGRNTAIELREDTSNNDIAIIGDATASTSSSDQDRLNPLAARDVDRIGSDGRASAIDGHSFVVSGYLLGNTLAGTGDVEMGGTDIVAATEGARIKAYHATAEAGRTGFDAITTSLKGIYGTLAVHKYTGEWTYTLDNTDSDTRGLNEGAVATETFQILVTDEEGALNASNDTDSRVAIRITGREDAPVLGFDGAEAHNLRAKELGGHNNNQRTTPATSGTLAAALTGAVALGAFAYADDDAADTDFGAGGTIQGRRRTDQNMNNDNDYVDGASGNGRSIGGEYGTLSVRDNGVWEYVLDDTNAAVQALNGGEMGVLSETFQFRIQDTVGTTTTNIYSRVATVVIDIEGSNDAPILSQAATGLFVQDPTSPVSGTLTFSDIDSADIDANFVIVASTTRADVESATTPPNAGRIRAATIETVTGTYGAFTIDRTTADQIDWAYTIIASDSDAMELRQYVANQANSFSSEMLYIRIWDDGGLSSEIQTIEVEVRGINDKPVLVGSGNGDSGRAVARTMTEQGYLVAGTATVTGELTHTDPDAGQGGFDGGTFQFSSGAGNTGNTDYVLASTTTYTGNGTYGQFTLTTNDGDWVYTLDNTGSGTRGQAVDRLNQGEMVDEVFNLRIRDGDYAVAGTPADTVFSDSLVITITITGTNDAPIITTTDGARTFTDASADDHIGQASAPQTFMGEATASDVDADDNTFTWTGTLQNAAGKARFATDASLVFTGGGANGGAWEFTPDAAGFNSLAQGITEQLIYDITATDAQGAPSVMSPLTIMLQGVNDAPELTVNAVDGTVIEAGGTDDNTVGDAMADGSLNIMDPDMGHNDFAFAGNTLQGRAGTSGVFKNANGVVENGVTSDGQIIGTYGTLTLGRDGIWSYALRNDDPDTQGLRGALNDGTAAAQVVRDEFQIQLVNVDGTTEISAIVPITIDVTGANDNPKIRPASVADLEINAVPGNRMVTRMFQSDDDDTGDTATWSIVTPVPDEEVYGRFSVDSSGQGTFTFGDGMNGDVDGQAGFDAIAAGDTVRLEYTVRATDRSGGTHDALFGIVLQGVNDAPVISPPTNPAPITANTDNAAGTFQVSDADGDTIFRWVATGPTTYGTLEFADTDGQDMSANGAWTFTLDRLAFDGIADGITETVTFNITADDGNGGVSAPVSVMITLQGVNDAPVISPPTNPAPITANTGNASGTFQVSDVDGDTIFRWVATGPTTYGTLEFADTDGTDMSANGAWTFTLDQSAFDGIADGMTETVTFNITADDGNGGVSAPVSVQIMLQGVNEAPVITPPTNPAPITANTGNAAGTFQVDDADGDAIFKWVATRVAAGPTTYGTLEFADTDGQDMSADGAWTFTLDRLAFDGIADGMTETVTFNITADDGNGGVSAPVSVMITLQGINDAPVISPPTNPAPITANTGNASGTFQVSDVDGDTIFRWVATGPTTYGTLEFADTDGTDMSADGAWTFTLDQTAFDGIADGITETVTFNITADDGNGGVSAPVSIMIMLQGANEAPVISPPTNPAPITANTGNAAGTFQVSDADGDTIFRWVATGPTTYGTLEFADTNGQDMSANGAWTFTLDRLAFDGIADGITETVTFNITADDGNGGVSAPVSVQIMLQGINDAPVISPPTNPAPITANTGNAAGTFQVSDADGDTIFRWVATRVAAGPTTYGTLEFADTNGTDMSANGAWTFTLDQTAFDGIANGMTETVTFNITADDGNGGVSAPVSIMIMLQGANEAPVISPPTNPAPITANTGNAAGTFQVSDADGDTIFRWVATRVAAGPTTYGTLEFADTNGTDMSANGAWTFTLDQTAFDGIADGMTETVTFNITADDGNGGVSAPVSIMITLQGVNEAPVISPPTNPAPITANTGNAAGTFQVSDVDGDTIFRWVATGPTTYGTLEFADTDGQDMSANGAWTFTLDQSAFDGIADGMTETVTFNITADDGNGGVSAPVSVMITLQGVNDDLEILLEPTQSNAFVFLFAFGEIGVERGGAPVDSGLSYGVGLSEVAARGAIGTYRTAAQGQGEGGQGQYGIFVLDPSDGSWTYTLTEDEGVRNRDRFLNPDGPTHDSNEFSDVAVYVAVQDASGAVDTSMLTFRIGGTDIIRSGRGTDANELLIGSAGPNRITTGEGYNGVYSKGMNDTITLGTGSTSPGLQNDVIYHRFSSDTSSSWSNTDDGGTIHNFVRNQDQFIFIDEDSSKVGEGQVLGSSLFSLTANIARGVLEGFTIGFTSDASKLITINYHNDHRVTLTNDNLAKYGLANMADGGQSVMGAEAQHNYFGDDNEHSFQVIDAIPAAFSDFA